MDDGDYGSIGLEVGEIMKLLPREIEKLGLHQVGFLAQERLAHGIRLNYTEVVALIATQVLEFVREGDKSLVLLMEIGRQLLGSWRQSMNIAMETLPPTGNLSYCLKRRQNLASPSTSQLLHRMDVWLNGVGHWL